MNKERNIYTISIVLLGNFNPSIITPFWLAHKGLVREIEAEVAEVDVIHPNISKFTIPDWLSVEASQNRIEFKTNKESHFEILRDLVVSIFSNLGETPLNAFGINHLSHFSLRDKDEYEKFGYWLSPVEKLGSLLKKPKLQSIQFRETKLDEDDNGLITFTISPSDLLHDRKSVVFNTNHHFVVNDTNNDADKVIRLLVRKWDSSFKRANELNKLLWEKVEL